MEIIYLNHKHKKNTNDNFIIKHVIEELRISLIFPPPPGDGGIWKID